MLQLIALLLAIDSPQTANSSEKFEGEDGSKRKPNIVLILADDKY